MIADDWLDNKFSGEFFSGKLEHLKEILTFLNIDISAKIITIVGTNGKGQTSRYIAEGLYQNNKSYALWTSPHLYTVAERFVFNHEDASQEELVDIFKIIDLKLKSFEKYQVSYFEFLFLCFLKLSELKNVNYLVLEAGLGGRLDAVNALSADVVLLTSISRDHQDLLGNRYEQILKEKLGVLRDGQEFISSLELNYLRDKALRYCQKFELNRIDLFEENIVNLDDHFSERNKKMAQYLLKKTLALEKISVLANYNNAYRSEFKCFGALITLFPTHNVDGLRKLVQFFNQEQYNNDQLLIVSFSRRSMTDLRAMMSILIQFFRLENIRVFNFQHIKAIDKNTLNKLTDEFNLNVHDYQTIESEIRKSGKAQVIVAGSNYFLGEFLRDHKRPS